MVVTAPGDPTLATKIMFPVSLAPPIREEQVLGPDSCIAFFCLPENFCMDMMAKGRSQLSRNFSNA